MDKYEVRRLRLIELMKTRCGGKASEIAKRIDRSESYVSRMMYPEGKAGKKRIGEDMAALITQTFDLPLTWLDGETASVDVSEKAQEVARAFDQLNAIQQQAIITMIESYGLSVASGTTTTSAPKEDNSAASSSIVVTTGGGHGQKQSFGSS